MGFRHVSVRALLVGSLLLASLGVFATVPPGADALPFMSIGEEGWFAQVTPPGTGELRAVDFVDVSHGWAAGYAWNDLGDDVGVILATVDGGDTWTAQSAGGAASLSGVCFVDAAHGWAVGSS